MFTLIKPTHLGLQITDITGKLVYDRDMEWSVEGSKKIELDLRYLNPGIYFCNIQTSEGIVSKKISIVK